MFRLAATYFLSFLVFHLELAKIVRNSVQTFWSLALL